MTQENRIVRSRARCLVCKTVLESIHVHDYVTCGCPQQTMLDGGREYVRYGGAKLSNVELMTEYEIS